MLTPLGVGFTRILANKVVEDLRYGIQSDVRAFLCVYGSFVGSCVVTIPARYMKSTVQLFLNSNYNKDGGRVR